MPKRSRRDDQRGHGDKRSRQDEGDRWGRRDYRPHHERSSTWSGHPSSSGSGYQSGYPSGSSGYRPGPHRGSGYQDAQPRWQHRQYGAQQPTNYVSGQGRQQYWEWQPEPRPSLPGSAPKPSSSTSADVAEEGDDVIELGADVIEISDEEASDKNKSVEQVQGYSQESEGHQSYYAEAGRRQKPDKAAEAEEEEGAADDNEDVTQAYAQAAQFRQQYTPSSKYPSKFQLETAARDVINKLAQDNQNLVSSHMIEKALLKYFKEKDIRDLGIKFIDDINFVHDHLKLQGRVSSYIQAYCSMATISSYYDLKECLQEFTPETGNFLDLNLGPLSKQPLVYKYFKIPANYKLPKITGAQVWMHLKDFMTENNLWTGQVDLNEFIKHLQTMYNVPSPLHLGIRVQSLPLAIQMLKKAQKDQGRNLRTAFMQYKMELANDVSRAFQNFKAEVLEKTDKGWEVKKFYCQASVPQVTGSIFNKLQILFNAILYQNDQKWKELKKMSDVVASFSSRLAEDRLLASLFQLAVSISSHDFQEDLVKKIFPHMGGGKTGGDGEESSGEKRKVKPNAGDLLSKLDKYIQRCLTHGQLTLEQMSKVEQKIVENYERDHFGELGYGNFLSYISNTREVGKLLEDLGVNLSGGVGGAGGGGSRTAYQPSLADVMDIVTQSKADPTVEAEHIEGALCSHYRVESVKCLGYGPISSVLIAHERNQKKQHGEHQTVYYESALCANSTLVRAAAESVEVGRLGPQSREVALTCLQSCPLLEDLSEWSQWDLVFEPELGPLKQFIHKHGGCHSVQLQGGAGTYQTDIVAMETEPGRLLKLTSQTSVDHYVTALSGGDVTNSCGHMISVIIQSQGLRNAPISLLANHTLQHLMGLQNRELEKKKEGKITADSPVITFVRDCLVTLPLKLCHLLADKILLEPVSQVVGGTRSKLLLLESARSALARNKLHSLGILLGVSEWRDHYQTRVREAHGGVVKRCQEEKKLLEALVPADPDAEESSSEEEEEEEVVDDNYLDSEDEPLQEPGTTAAIPKPQKPAAKPTGAATCREIVEAIRREEFGIGMVLNEDAKKLLEIQQERLGRSLDRLSKDLYSKDTHFVLELIQNADDNTYPEALLDPKAKTGPSLQFTVNDRCITVLNNETGFLERNIRAICDVGKSTKGKHSGGYIGQKGIGFKSVFRISDRPEIHSKGFHIYFDAKSGPMGYILPHWGDGQVEKDWVTKIVLPLKEFDADADIQQVRSLANRFYDIHPSLLLFLRRLRQIIIVHQNDDEVLKMTRRDVGKNVIEIKHNQGTDRWLVIKKQLDASKISLQAKSGVDIAYTDLSLAFPILPQEESPVLPPKQPLFAFLPLRSYGFRFVVQGDFDVPSSREDVDSDSTWNQWLRSEIPTVFVEALEQFKNHPSLDLLDGVLNYLQFVPLEDELLDFFKPVALQILRRLRAKPCLPVVPPCGESLMWRVPSQIIVCQDHHVLELISATILEEHLGLYYLHPKVGKQAQLPLLKSLGVKTLNTEHLLEVGRSLVRMWTQRDETGEFPDDVISSVSRWFVCIARSLDDFANNKDDVKYIKTLDLIPLADGAMTSLERSRVFFPPDQTDDEFLSMRLLRGDFCMCDVRLTTSLDKVSNLMIRQLLAQLGVRDSSPANVVQYHILPTLHGAGWKEKEQSTLEAYVRHLRHLYMTSPLSLDLSDVTSCIRLSTNQGLLCPGEADIHFSQYYNNPVNLAKTFPSQEWVLVEKSYLKKDLGPANVRSWRQFLQAVGVRDFIHVREEVTTRTAEELTDSPFADLVASLSDLDGPFTVTDFTSREFLALTRDPDYDHVTQMSHLTELVNNHFHSYQDSLSATLCDKHGKNQRDADSSFKTLLCKTQWLPGRTVKYTNVGGSLTCERDIKLYSSEELFLPQLTLKRCLSDHVPYLQTTLTEKTEFVKELGLTHTITGELMTEFLLKWSARKFVSEPAEFVTSVEHMRTVYTFLHDNVPRSNLRTFFQENPVIFVPRKAFTNADDVTVGDFYRLDDVMWSDPTGIFFKHQEKLKHEKVITLSNVYPSLEHFFLDFLSVKKLPTLFNYIEALRVSAEPYISQGSNVRDCIALMEFLGRCLSEMDEEQRDETVIKLKVKLKGARFIPLKRAVFVTLDDHPLIPDTNLLARFSGEDQEDLINVVSMETVDDNAPKQKETFTEYNIRYNQDHLLLFLESLGVERASACIEHTYKHNDAADSPHLQIYFHKIIPAVQLLLYNEHPACHQQLQEDGMADKFAEMGFYQVADLFSVYTLTHSSARHLKREKVLIYADENCLYIHDQFMDAFSDLHKELARYLSYGDEEIGTSIREFVTDLLAYVQGERVVDIAAMCKQRDWQLVPPEEAQWIVPEPKEPEPEPEPEAEVEEEDEAEEVDLTFDAENEIRDQDEPVDRRDRSDDEEEFDTRGHAPWPPRDPRDRQQAKKEPAKRVVRKPLPDENQHLDMRNAVPLFRGHAPQDPTNQSQSSLPRLPVSGGRHSSMTSSGTSQNEYQSALRPVMPFEESTPDKRMNLWGPKPIWWMDEWPPIETYVGPAPMGWIGPWPPRKQPWGEKPDNYNGLWPPPAYAVGTPPQNWAGDWPPRATIWGPKPRDWKGAWPPKPEYVGPAPSTWLGPWPPSQAWMQGHAEIWQRCGGQLQDPQTMLQGQTTEQGQGQTVDPQQTQAASYWLSQPQQSSEDADHWEEVPENELQTPDQEHYKYQEYQGKLYRKQIPYGVSEGQGQAWQAGLTFGPWEIFDGREFDEYRYEYANVDGYDYRRRIIRSRSRRERRGRERREEGRAGGAGQAPWEACDGTKRDDQKYEYYQEGGYHYRRPREQATVAPPSSGRGTWELVEEGMTTDESVFEYCTDQNGRMFRRQRTSSGSGGRAGPRWEQCTRDADINDTSFLYHMEDGKLYRCRADDVMTSEQRYAGGDVTADQPPPLPGSSEEGKIPKRVRQFTAKTAPSDLDLVSVMDDIALGREIMIPRHIKLDSAQGMTQLGRYGEQLVYQHLQQCNYAVPGHATLQIVWLNQQEETGDPFDILVRLRHEQTGAQVEVYIEVKATMSEDKGVFEITGREVEFAYKQGENYHLYRVYNANDPDKVRIARIRNLALKIDQKLVKLCMVI